MRGFTLLTATLPAAVLVSLAMGAAPASAQSEPGSDQLETITVVAPRITRQTQPGGKLRVASAEQTAQVEFEDLDLNRTSDLFTLEDRVRVAATRVCEELADLYPDGEPSTEVCVRRAVDDAMGQVRHTARARVGMR